MPRRRASAGEANRTGVPRKRISPSSGWRAPERIFMRVDFPAALSPTRPSTSPASRTRSTPRRAWTAPKRFRMPRISTRCALTAPPLPSYRRGPAPRYARPRGVPGDGAGGGEGPLLPAPRDVLLEELGDVGAGHDVEPRVGRVLGLDLLGDVVVEREDAVHAHLVGALAHERVDVALLEELQLGLQGVEGDHRKLPRLHVGDL